MPTKQPDSGSRSYRERLHLNWGIVDVDDCINGAKYLVAQGLVDQKRVVISGSSGKVVVRQASDHPTDVAN